MEVIKQYRNKQTDDISKGDKSEFKMHAKIEIFLGQKSVNID